MLKAGDTAPLQLKIKDQDGKTRTLAEYKGKKIIVFFYPKDDTPGCTKEACGIRDNWQGFTKLSVPVLGVSPDSPESHQKFIAKFKLPFTLLADEDKKFAEAFGAYGEKVSFGIKRMGIIRSTFVLDEHGVILKVFPKVTPEGHAEELLAIIG